MLTPNDVDRKLKANRISQKILVSQNEEFWLRIRIES
jgi:hypothetical protein